MKHKEYYLYYIIKDKTLKIEYSVNTFELDYLIFIFWA